ncbi:MAG TPA: pentapeptide repeat-containing protein [Gaiellales bacterium]|nr:pentapeptide repeat-containing protein [Gaiellales bacterium]
MLDLANTRLESIEVVSSSLRESRFIGATLVGSFRDVVLTDCQFDLASLFMCSFSRTEFHACSLAEVDASGAELRSVLLDDCNLTGADFSKAEWERSEIRACDLTGFRGVEDLAGVHIPISDLLLMAPLLATTLGIIPIH